VLIFETGVDFRKIFSVFPNQLMNEEKPTADLPLAPLFQLKNEQLPLI